jgi:hypothetical protein
LLQDNFSFSHPILCVNTILSMLMGELEFSDNFPHSNTTAQHSNGGKFAPKISCRFPL